MGLSFAAALLILLLGLFPRDVLDDRNNFIRYNSFNQVIAAEHINEAEQLIINIDKRSTRRRTYPVLELRFIFEEHTYVLPLHGFRRDDPEAAIKHMLHLKSFFRPGEYEITNADRIEWLLWDEDFNARETELVYELFDYTDE